MKNPVNYDDLALKLSETENPDEELERLLDDPDIDPGKLTEAINNAASIIKANKEAEKIRNEAKEKARKALRQVTGSSSTGGSNRILPSWMGNNTERGKVACFIAKYFKPESTAQYMVALEEVFNANPTRFSEDEKDKLRNHGPKIGYPKNCKAIREGWWNKEKPRSPDNLPGYWDKL